jgi:two-component system sensor histidine kinase MprB
MGLAAGGAVALAVIAVVVIAYAGTRTQLLDQLDSQLRGLAQPILDAAHGHGPGGPGGPRPRDAGSSAAPHTGAVGDLFSPGGSDGSGGAAPPAQDCDGGLGLDLGAAPRQGQAPGLRVFVTPQGHVCRVGTSAARLPVPSRTKALARTGRGSFISDAAVAGASFRMLAVGVPGRGAVEVALSLANVDHALNDELLLLALIGAGGIALAALLGILVARTALLPVARFTLQAESIAAHPDRVERERLEVRGEDELARLGRTFNATLDALEESIVAQRNLVADASHELRTPIATLKANLQLMRDEALLSPEDRAALRSDMIEELDELTRLVADVVELARGAKPAPAPDDVRVDLIASAAIERARRRAPELTFEARLEPTLVHGDGARIERAITNLLDNASKWSPSGGSVELELADGVVSVRDHGPGFEPNDLPFVFDRFHRAKTARATPGSGLGLAIVRQAAQSHGGFAQAANAIGGGALMRVSFGQPLPLAQAAIPGRL